MAESLGEVALAVRVDTAQAIAGLNAVRQAAERSLKIRQTPALPQIKADPFKGLGDSADTARGAARSLGGELARTIAGFASVGAVATLFKQSIDAAVELETITKKLSNTLGEGGAAKALSFTKGLANDLGLSFKVLASSFGSFTAAATSASVPLKTQEELFKAVATSSQRLGLSNDELKGSLLALQQVAAKGTVQMEELRGQLGERLPVAFGATAKGLGITQKELIKLVETGQLTSTQFFGALTKGLNELAGASAGAPTVAQSFQQLGNAWDELQTSFGQNSLPKVTEGVKILQSVIEGLGRKTIADRLGFNTGAVGNLGILSDGAFNAVEAFKSLQKQFNLTDKQATALFFDAKKSKGFLPDQNLTAEQTDVLIAEVERLAENFRERFPISEPLIDQAIVDKTLNTVKKIQDQIKEQQQKQSGFTVDSAAFAEAQKELTELGIKLKEIDGKKAQISAEYTLTGIDSGKIANSIQNVQQSLQDLKLAQVSVNIDSSAFSDLSQRIVETQDDLDELEARKAVITAEFILKGIQDGTITNSISKVRTALENLNTRQATLDVDSSAFIDVTRQIVDTEDDLRQLDGRKATITAELIAKGIQDGSISNSIASVNAELQNLELAKVSLDIDSSELDVVITKLVRARENQDALNKASAGKELGILREELRTGKSTNSEDNLERQISLLRTEQKKVDLNSEAYKNKGKEIEKLTKLQAKYNEEAKGNVRPVTPLPLPQAPPGREFVRVRARDNVKVTGDGTRFDGSETTKLVLQANAEGRRQLQEAKKQIQLAREASRSFPRLEQTPDQAKATFDSAGKSIRDNLVAGANEARSKLLQASDSLRSALKGSFEFLTKNKQGELLREAQQNITQASRFGFDSTKTARLRKPEDILAAGDAAAGLIQAGKQLEAQARQTQIDLSRVNRQANAAQFLARREFDNFNAAFAARFTPRNPLLDDRNKVATLESRDSKDRRQNFELEQKLVANAKAIIDNTDAVNALASKDWSVALNVSPSSGATTVNTLNSLI